MRSIDNETIYFCPDCREILSSEEVYEINARIIEKARAEHQISKKAFEPKDTKDFGPN